MNPFTRTFPGRWLMVVFISSLFFYSCKKEISPVPDGNEVKNVVSNEGMPGHLKQTKTFSSEVVTKWMEMQLRVIRTTPGMPPTTNSRFFGYSGVALYESVQPGMPAYQSLSGQLTALPAMPEAMPGYQYHWAASANAALAFMTKGFFSTTSSANKAAIDSLENALNEVYKAEIDDETYDRSSSFGRTVSELVFDWSKTDGANLANAPYTLPAGPGLWVRGYP